MLEQGSGCIINVASVAAHRGFQLSAPYTMSKHGVLALTRIGSRMGDARCSGECDLAGFFHDAAQSR